MQRFILFLSIHFFFIGIKLQGHQLFTFTLRRVRDVFVLPQEISEQIVERAQNARVVAMDLDGTLREGEKIPQELIEIIKKLASRGIHIAVVTRASWGEIDQVLIKRLGDDFNYWEFLHLYPREAHNGYGYDYRGRRLTYYETIESQGMVIQQPEPGFEFSSLDKSLAIEHLMHILEITPEQIFVLGDSFYWGGNDLPMAIPGVLAFNVGSSLENGPSNVISFPNTPLWGPALSLHILSTILNSIPGHTYRILTEEEKVAQNLPLNFDLVQDEQGERFYLYSPLRNVSDIERTIERKVKVERFAYLYGKDFVNLAEVRKFDINYLKGTAFYEWWDENIRWYQPTTELGYSYDWREYREIGVSRLASEYNFQELVQKQGSLEGLIVFWTAIRDVNDHLYDAQSGELLDLAVIEQNGQQHFLSYDHGAGIPFAPEYLPLWEIENFSRALLWKWVFERELDYRALAQTALKFKNRTSSEIEDILKQAGFEGKNLELTLGNLVRAKDNIFQDLEYLIRDYKGEMVNLEDFL